MWKKQQDRKKRKANRPVDSRYFRTNDELSYISIPEVTLSGDFEQHYLFTSSNAGAQVLAGNSSGTKNFIAIRGDNAGIQIQIRINDNNLDLNSAPITFGNLNHLVIRRVSGVVSIDVNSVTQPETATMAGDFSIDQLCRNSAGNYLVGILANVLMYDNGTLVRNYPINDNSNTIADISGNSQNGSVVNGNASDWELFNQQADGDWLGQELVVNGSFDNDLSGWSIGSGGGWSWQPSEAVGTNLDSFDKTIDQAGIMTIGLQYRISYIGSVDAGAIGMQIQDGSIPVAHRITTSVNSVEFDYTSDLVLFSVKREAGNVPNATLDNVSIKRLLRVA